ncbi:MAG: hypothetical protein IKM04_08500 [Clostridia bacterium]|nr:hypothetical protein [Clostridia bacterium]
MKRENAEAKLAESISEIRSLAESAEGKALVSSLDKETLSGIKKAADGVKNGDSAAMRDMLILLKNSREGNEILKRLAEITKK